MGPQFGIAGTRKLMGVPSGPMIGMIVKPSVGLSAEQTAPLANELAQAGIDFIKDDELQGNGPACLFDDRAKLVMQVLNKTAQKVGREVMYAFNITDEIDVMRRNIDQLECLGASCVMASLNLIGLAGLRAIRDHSPLPIHAHRNELGLMSRSPHVRIVDLGMQKLWRLAGSDHLHVNGLANKFTEDDTVVTKAARAVDGIAQQRRLYVLRRRWDHEPSRRTCCRHHQLTSSRRCTKSR